jgi:hypothetical protein
MPQNDVVSKALESAKSSLGHAATAFPSSPASAPAKSAPVAQAAPASIGVELKAKQDNVNRYMSAPKMHNGGPVLTDGSYQLKAGEHVLTAPAAEKARKHAIMASGMKSLAKPANKAKRGSK